METLPPINKAIQSNVNSGLTSKIKTKRSRPAKKLKILEYETKRNDKIREELPILTKVETAKHRNSFKHSLCIEMLRNGFHKSFSELYNLIEDRHQQRLIAGKDSALWLEQSLNEQPEKLEELAKYLTKAESLERNGKWKDIYECRVRLAEYFLTGGDKWLSDYFFKSALETSFNIRLDGGRRKAEAYCNMALAIERNGKPQDAVSYMRSFQELTVGQLWKNDDDILLSSIACRHLCRIYTTLADSSEDCEEQLKLLHEAYIVASDSEESLQKAKCGLNLAKKYEEYGDSETSVQCLNECLELAQDIEDSLLYGEACQAMAVSLQSLGDIKRSNDFFQMFGDTAREANLVPEIATASCSLGKMKITQGEYNESIEYCTSAYQLSHQLGNVNVESTVLLGISQGCVLSEKLRQNIERPQMMVKKLVEWKDAHEDEFSVTSSEGCDGLSSSSSESTVDPTQPFRSDSTVKDHSTDSSSCLSVKPSLSTINLTVKQEPKVRSSQSDVCSSSSDLYPISSHENVNPSEEHLDADVSEGDSV